MTKDFFKDLTHATNFVHIGRLESYHNLQLKYMPKRNLLKYKGMYMIIIIAILDHNNNVNKKEVGEKIVFSKPASRYVIKRKYDLNKNDEWRENIMQKVHVHIKENNSTISEKFSLLAMPNNIVPQPKPSYNDLTKKNSQNSKNIN